LLVPSPAMMRWWRWLFISFLLAGCTTSAERHASETPVDESRRQWREEDANIARCAREIPYPADAQRDGVGGDVVLRVEISERGVPTSASVISSPDERLTTALVASLGKCRFRIAPGADGKPVSRVIPKYTFHFEPPSPSSVLGGVVPGGDAAADLRQRVPELLRCFEAELAQRPDLEGHIDVDVSVNEDGHLTEMRAAESTIANDESIRRCLVDTTSRWQLVHPTEPTVVRIRVPWEAGAHASFSHLPPGRGSLDKEMIRLVIHSHLGEVRACYERALIETPTLAGRVFVRFTIAGDGRVLASTIQESSLGRPDVEHCMSSAVTAWRFPRPANGGVVIVSYPFTLKVAK
jgi:TonB family protein